MAAPSAATSNATCLAYDNIYPSLRSDVVAHLAYHQALLDGTVEQAFPEGYAAPAYFYSWPAHGDVALGQDQYLAPFIDFDGDGAYNPDSGDAPGYNVNGSCDPGEAGSLLSGDANWFWIFNDAGRVHNESNGASIGMEIRAQSWAFNDGGPDFDNATFYTYELLNQGPFTLNSFQTGVWVDADVGTAVDDYVGCDVSRGVGLCLQRARLRRTFEQFARLWGKSTGDRLGLFLRPVSRCRWIGQSTDNLGVGCPRLFGVLRMLEWVLAMAMASWTTSAWA